MNIDIVQAMRRASSAIAEAPNAEASDVIARATKVVAVAAANAVAVDQVARFPREAIETARDLRLLAVMVPRAFGGEGASVSDAAQICYRLGQACSSTAMIYAMHQACVACIVRHGSSDAAHQHTLSALAARQILIASSTTEGQNGADIRKSSAAIEPQGDGISLERKATVLSYAAEADAILTLARRAPSAAASDQVLAFFQSADYVLEPAMDWDSLGMRGTCSAGFNLKASGEPNQILPHAYATIHAQTMMPVTHLLWASVWAGIAASAVGRAQLCLRAASRKAEGQMPIGVAHYTRAAASLKTLRALIASSLTRYEKAKDDATTMQSLDFQASMNLLKVTASELAVSIVMSTLQSCGLAGYRNDGPFSVSRHLRDVLSSTIMINNDRILSNLASVSMLSEVPTSLLD